jgi:hypothetical protein
MQLKLSLLALFLTAHHCVAQSAGDDFTPLCNGRDLAGWTPMHGADFAVRDGMIVCTGRSDWPSWLRSDEVFENFVLRMEYKTYYGGESGVYFGAPIAGRVAKVGFEVQLGGHGRLTPYSTGAIFAAAAPTAMPQPLAEGDGYHELEISMDWPRLVVKIDGTIVQDVNCDEHPELRYKQRLGYIGFSSRGKRVDFRNVRIKRLPDRIQKEWKPMFTGNNLAGWTISDKCTAEWTIDHEGILQSSDGHGYLISGDEYDNCEWQCFYKTTELANGGIFFDWIDERSRGFEIQIEDILDSNDPTGSIYGRVRATHLPHKQGEWSHLHVILRDNVCVVRIDGETVAESNTMNNRRRGRISLQMHRNNASVFWKEMQVRRLP